MSHDCWGGVTGDFVPPVLSGVQLIDTATAAAALGVTPGCVRQLGSRGQLTRYGTSRRQLWDLTEVRRRALRKKYGNSGVSLDTI